MSVTIAEVPRYISDLLGGRAVRWVCADRLVGDYDGRQRSLEVFHASAGEQRKLLRIIRSVRAEIEGLIGGPLIVIFHTPDESERLYPDAGGAAWHYHQLAALVAEWMTCSHPDEPSYDPDKIERLNLEAA